MTIENELSRYFKAIEANEKSMFITTQEEYSFDAFQNLLRQSPEYILIILEEIKKVHDEALLTLKNEAVDKVSFKSMVHKVKGGAQILSAARFIQACNTLQREGNLNEQVTALIQLLEEQNQIISRYQAQYLKS